MRLLFFYFALLIFVSGATVTQQAEEALSQGRYFYAYELLSNIDGLDSEGALLLLESAIMSDSRVEEAVAQLESASDATTLYKRDFWLAIWELKRGEIGNALSAFNRLYLSEHTTYKDDVRRNLAKIYMGFDNAEESIRLILEGDITDSVQDRLIYAEALLQNGNIEKSEQVMTSGIFQGEVGPQKNLLLGYIYYQKGKLGKALETLGSYEWSALTLQGRTALSLMATIHSEEGRSEGYEVMLSVIKNAKEEDPFSDYIDQLLIAAENKKHDNAEIKKDLGSLRADLPPKLQPTLLFTLAQLEKDVAARISYLTELSREFPDHSMAPKTNLMAAQLALQIKDEKERKEQLQKVLDNTGSASVKAKINSWLAEGSVGNEKMGYYKAALSQANQDQKPIVRLNYNLSQIHLPKHKQNILVLPTEQNSYYLYEKGVSALEINPDEAADLLEDFLRVSQDDKRAGLAHLILAERKLASHDDKNANEVKAHLDTIDTFYPETKRKYESRYVIAELHYGALSKDDSIMQKITKTQNQDKALLFQSAKILYDYGNAYAASIQLKKLNDEELNVYEAELKEFYLALSYLQLGTTEYQQIGISSLEAQAVAGGRLAAEARMMLANYYLEQANSKLALKYIDGIKEDSKVLLLKARAYSLQDDTESQKLTQKYYSQLIKERSLPAIEKYQVIQQYGKYLESARLHEDEIALYEKLIEFKQVPRPSSDEEWRIFKGLCIRSVSLLESLGEWRKAYTFSKKVEQTELPDKQYFLDKAREISLKHIIWEE